MDSWSTVMSGLLGYLNVGYPGFAKTQLLKGSTKATAASNVALLSCPSHGLRKQESLSNLVPECHLNAQRGLAVSVWCVWTRVTGAHSTEDHPS